MKDSIKITLGIIAMLIGLFVGYKIQEWKLKHIYEVKNPTFWQVVL